MRHNSASFYILTVQLIYSIWHKQPTSFYRVIPTSAITLSFLSLAQTRNSLFLFSAKINFQTPSGITCEETATVAVNI